MKRIATVAVCVFVLLGALASTASASFGFKPGKEGFAVSVKTQDGKPSSDAGTHPGEWSMHLGLN